MTGRAGDPITDLERGYWRSALLTLHPPGDGPVPGIPDPRAGAALRRIAAAMAHRAAGSPAQAQERLEEAARLMLLGGRSPFAADRSGPRGWLRLEVPPDPPADPRAHLVWRVAMLVWREQRELDHLVERLGAVPAGRPELRHALVLAMVEHLVLVENDVTAWLGPRVVRPGIPDVGPELTREGLLLRATALWRFVQPKETDVSKAVWNGAGHELGLRIAAFEELRNLPMPPWTTPAAPGSLHARVSAHATWHIATGR